MTIGLTRPHVCLFFILAFIFVLSVTSETPIFTTSYNNQAGSSFSLNPTSPTHANFFNIKCSALSFSTSSLYPSSFDIILKHAQYENTLLSNISSLISSSQNTRLYPIAFDDTLACRMQIASSATPITDISAIGYLTPDSILVLRISSTQLPLFLPSATDTLSCTGILFRTEGSMSVSVVTSSNIPLNEKYMSLVNPIAPAIYIHNNISPLQSPYVSGIPNSYAMWVVPYFTSVAGTNYLNIILPDTQYDIYTSVMLTFSSLVLENPPLITASNPFHVRQTVASSSTATYTLGIDSSLTELTLDSRFGSYSVDSATKTLTKHNVLVFKLLDSISDSNLSKLWQVQISHVQPSDLPLYSSPMYYGVSSYFPNFSPHTNYNPGDLGLSLNWQLKLLSFQVKVFNLPSASNSFAARVAIIPKGTNMQLFEFDPSRMSEVVFSRNDLDIIDHSISFRQSNIFELPATSFQSSTSLVFDLPVLTKYMDSPLPTYTVIVSLFDTSGVNVGTILVADTQLVGDTVGFQSEGIYSTQTIQSPSQSLTHQSLSIGFIDLPLWKMYDGFLVMMPNYYSQTIGDLGPLSGIITVDTPSNSVDLSKYFYIQQPILNTATHTVSYNVIAHRSLAPLIPLDATSATARITLKWLTSDFTPSNIQLTVGTFQPHNLGVFASRYTFPIYNQIAVTSSKTIFPCLPDSVVKFTLNVANVMHTPYMMGTPLIDLNDKNYLTQYPKLAIRSSEYNLVGSQPDYSYVIVDTIPLSGNSNSRSIEITTSPTMDCSTTKRFSIMTNAAGDIDGTNWNAATQLYLSFIKINSKMTWIKDVSSPWLFTLNYSFGDWKIILPSQQHRDWAPLVCFTNPIDIAPTTLTWRLNHTISVSGIVSPMENIVIPSSKIFKPPTLNFAFCLSPPTKSWQQIELSTVLSSDLQLIATYNSPLIQGYTQLANNIQIFYSGINRSNSEFSTDLMSSNADFSVSIITTVPPQTVVPSENNGSNCPNVDTFGENCSFTQVNSTTSSDPSIPPTVTKPPPPTATLPTVVPSMTNMCEYVIDVTKQITLYNDTQHKDMCSIPTAGSLLLDINRSHYPDLPFTSANKGVCDCLCQGYWADNAATLDYKKCSKCSLQCPTHMSPNTACTTCECVSAECKLYTKYLFSTIYFDLEVLDLLVNPTTHDIAAYQSPSGSTFMSSLLASTSTTPPTTPLKQQQMTIAHQKYLSYASSAIKTRYTSVMNALSTQISAALYQQETDAIASLTAQSLYDPSQHASLLGLSLSPLIQGSYLVWKVSYSVLPPRDASRFTPANGYGLLFSPLSTTFISAHFITAIDTSNIITIGSRHGSITVSNVAPLMSVSSGYYLNDAITTLCAPYTLVIAENERQKSSSSTTTPSLITPSGLSKCPLPTQYTTILTKSTNKIDVTATDLANPLWSPCLQRKTSVSGTSTIEPTIPTHYPIYEELFSSTTTTLSNISTASITTRNIFPYCFDFTGIDISKYYVPCDYYTYNDFNGLSSVKPLQTSQLFYSTQRKTILMPSYLQRLLNSLNMNDIDSTAYKNAKDFIIAYQGYILPSYPNFPLSTSIVCDNTSGIVIGDELPPASISTTPTMISPSQHSHIVWEFDGVGDQTTLTLQVRPVVTPSTLTPSNDHVEQFPWSQILGSYASSSLFTTTQFPSARNSQLYTQLYAQVNEQARTASLMSQPSQQHPLVAMYNQTITFDGFLTQYASEGSKQRNNDVAVTFNLPLQCDLLKVKCAFPTSQFCNQLSGRCECQSGYIMVGNITMSTEGSSYIKDEITGANIDGTELHCEPICQNGGMYNLQTGECHCLDTYTTTGKYCEIVSECHPTSFFSDNETQETEQLTLPKQLYTKECTNGYYPYAAAVTSTDDATGMTTVTSPATCSGEINLDHAQCLCYGDFWGIDTDNRCTKCLLRPSSTDTMITQVYNEGIQRCYITGTDPITYTNGHCQECICRRGYSGKYCNINTVYSKFTYTGNNNNKSYLYDETNKALLFDKFAHELMLSMTNYDRNKITVVEHNIDQRYLIVAIQTDLDYFQLNADSPSRNTQGFSMLTLDAKVMQILAASTPVPSSTSDLYQQWLDMQKNFNNSAVNNQDSSAYLGGVQPPADPEVHDPSCEEQGFFGCANGADPFDRKSQSGVSISIIIGVVIAGVIVLLVFVITIGCVAYAKKNKKWCYTEKKKQDDAFAFQDNSYKGSTDAPSTVGSTISLMPMSATASSTSSPVQSIKSVNNHTEVDDPTLKDTDWKAYKDAKGTMFYVNQITMKSSWKHPLKGEEDDNGW